MTTTRRNVMIGAMAGLALAAWARAGDVPSALELRADATERGSALAPADEKFTVDVHGFEIFRYNWNHRDGNDTAIVAAGGHENTNGFQGAYTKLQVGGKIIDDTWAYGIQFKFSEVDGTAILDDAWASHKFECGWTVKWGQFKAPFLREETTPDTAQLSANRSVMNSAFSISRTQGVQLSRECDQFRFAGMFDDGSKTNNTDFTATNEADFGLTARGDWKWAGKWDASKDFTSFPDSENFGLVGAAAHYQSGGDTFATTDTQLFGLMVDTQIEGNGWNLYGAGVYRHTETTGSPTFTDWGFIAQGGIFVAPQWELFGRYDVVIPDGDRATDDSMHTFTVGTNYYVTPKSHAAKFTADLEWFSATQNKTLAPSSTLTGLLPSDQDGQWIIQLQMQIVF